jgi:hypothetical protein
MDYAFEITNPTVIINDIDISDLLLEAYCTLEEDRGLHYEHGKVEVILRFQYRVFGFSIKKDDRIQDLIDGFSECEQYNLTVIKTKRGRKKTLRRDQKSWVIS